MSYPPFGANDQPAPAVEQPPRQQVAVRPPTSRPVVTYAILGVTIFFYLLQELNHMGIAREPFLALAQWVFGPEDFQALLQNGWGNELPILLGGKITPLIVEGQYWRLLTPALLHASLTHVGANMYSLFIIGTRLERFYGHGRFLGLYILSAIGGNVLSFLLSDGISVGASTAIFGLLVAEGVFAYQHRELFGQQARAMLNNIIFLLLLNLVIGFSVQVVDNWGHLGGLIVGLIFSWLAGPRLEVSYSYPDYVLVDQRSAATAWLIGVVLLIFLAGVVGFFIQLG